MGMREPSHWLLLTLPDPALSWFTNPQYAHCRTEPDQTRDYHTELFPLLQARQPLTLLPSLAHVLPGAYLSAVLLVCWDPPMVLS